MLGDGDRILQIVTNLVTNALDATPVGGEVTVDVAVGAGVGQVIVSDTGPGIPEEDRVAILRPFVTSSVRHGIGLGLPVSSELAQAMGGTLVVGERPGGGAAFTLSLPLAGWIRRRSEPGARLRARRRIARSAAGTRAAARARRRIDLAVLGGSDLGHRLLQAVDERSRDRPSDLVVDGCGHGHEQCRDGQHDADVLDRALAALGLHERATRCGTRWIGTWEISPFGPPCGGQWWPGTCRHHVPSP